MRAALAAGRAACASLALGAAAAVAAGLAADARLAARARQGPVFKSGVEVIAIDVRVIDKDGRPIGGLRPEQFEVSIDGRPRRVVSADFVEYAAGDGVRAAVGKPEDVRRPRFSSSEEAAAAPSPGRLIYLAVDQGSFKPLAARGAMEAARRFIDRLQPGDRVGFVAFPAPGPLVEASRDHAAARAATAQIVGRALPLKSDGLDKNVSLGEAIDIRAGDAIVLEKVLARECAGLGPSARPACELAVRDTALAVGHSAEMQATRSLAGMESIVRSLARISGRKTLVFLSAGLPVSDRSGRDLQFLPWMTSLGREAAAANLNLYVLHVDSGFLDAFSAENRTVSDALDRDLSLTSGGLEAIAGSGGGTLIRVVAGADHAFDRVQRETAAEYLLGVEPAQSDRDGRPHRIAVKVAVDGAEVRSRRELVLAAASRVPGKPIDPVRSPAPVRPVAAAFAGRPSLDLPVSVATWVMTARSGRHTVYVSADIGGDFAGPAGVEVMYAFTDAAGRTHAPIERSDILLPRRTGRPGSLAFAVRDELEPGSYTLRFAASDASGRSGWTDHRFTVAPRTAGTVEFSDLLLLEPQQDGEAMPAIVTTGALRLRAVEAHLEVAPLAPDAAVAEVTIGVASATDPALLVSESAFLSRGADRAAAWTAVAYLDLGELPPGDYVAMAIVSNGDRELGRVDRPFRIEGVPPQGLPFP
ncbi:MAG TPA: VWA domain-containing protein [Vicinamibacterales bacterium]|nr:VWA domain-containing protein [Vicinamibacterales bacterium]HOQ58978.1 VWA domain-containing protein [Vicinamibacterales bacterium]